MSDVEEGGLCELRVSVHEIHDRALVLTDYAGVRFGDEVAHRRGVPVVAASHAAPIVQSLLYHGPLAVRCHNKAMEVDLKSVGDRIVVDARGKPAGADQGFAIEDRLVMAPNLWRHMVTTQ